MGSSTGGLKSESAEPARTEAELGRSMKAARRRVYWFEAMTGLWTPFMIFLGLFTLYILIVQFSPDAAQWAHPLMQTLGLICLGYFVVLLVAREAYRPLARRRKLSVEAGELASELRSLMRRKSAKIDERAKRAVTEAVDAMELRRLQFDTEGLPKAIEAAAASADRHLSVLRKGHPMEWVSWIGKPLLAAILIRTVLVEPFYIPTGSMIPTVEIEDKVLVNRFIYGVRIPFINVVPVVFIRRPARGDVIVFNNPVDPSVDYIKRVMAVPGDTLEIIDDTVYINGQPQKRDLISKDHRFYDRMGETWTPSVADVFEEQVGNVRHLTQYLEGVGQRNWGPYTVPEGGVFVMGDNRDASADSRYALGGQTAEVRIVPYGNIKGKAMVVWLSMSHGGLFSKYTSGWGIRLDRMFIPVR